MYLPTTNELDADRPDRDGAAGYESAEDTDEVEGLRRIDAEGSLPRGEIESYYTT